MKKPFKTLASLLLAGLFASSAAIAEEQVKMSLHDFMENYAKPAAELAKTGNEEPMIRVLAAIPAMALEADRKEWEELIEKAVAADKASGSCRACHRSYKKTYEKQHKDYQVNVSSELIAYLQAQQ